MNNYILSFITWLPAVGAILILALMKKDQSSLIKKFATSWFALDFIFSLWLLKYNRGIGGMQFLEDHEWIPVIGARYQMGVDGVAVLLIVLTTLLGVIAAFHERQRESGYELEDGGVRLGLRVDPLARAGIYAPGGTARYPSSVLMAAVPARIAGVGEIILCTPGPSP